MITLVNFDVRKAGLYCFILGDHIRRFSNVIIIIIIAIIFLKYVFLFYSALIYLMSLLFFILINLASISSRFSWRTNEQQQHIPTKQLSIIAYFSYTLYQYTFCKRSARTYRWGTLHWLGTLNLRRATLSRAQWMRPLSYLLTLQASSWQI